MRNLFYNKDGYSHSAREYIRKNMGAAGEIWRSFCVKRDKGCIQDGRIRANDIPRKLVQRSGELVIG